jgi:phage-related minor tail protein
VFGVDRVDKFFSETEEYAEKAVLSIGDFIKITFEMMGEDMKTFFEGIAEAVRNSGLGDATKTLAEGFIKAGQLLEDALTDAVLTGKLSFSSLADHIKKVLAKALIQKFITGPIMGLIPGLAEGGPATAGQPYVVGEEGPELFVPRGSGTVIPNDEMSSGGGGFGGATNVTYNIQATDAASFKSLVARDPEFIYNVSRAGQRRQPA